VHRRHRQQFAVTTQKGNPAGGVVVKQLVIDLGQRVTQLDPLYVLCFQNIQQVVNEHASSLELLVSICWVLLAKHGAARVLNLASGSILEGVDIP